MLYDWKLFASVSGGVQKLKASLDKVKADINQYDEVEYNEASRLLGSYGYDLSLIGHTNEIDTLTIRKTLADLSLEMGQIADMQTGKENKEYLAAFDKDLDALKTKSLNGEFSADTYAALQGRAAAIQDIYPDMYAKRSAELEEIKLYADTRASIAACRKQLESMDGDSEKLTQIKVQVVSDQIAAMAYNLTLFKVLDAKPLIDDHKGLTELLQSKVSDTDTEEQKQIRKYNSQVVALLERANRQNNQYADKDYWKDLGYSWTDKDIKHYAIVKGRKELLVSLERVETSYLFPSVYTLYNQVYSNIWSTKEGGTSLETEDQFEVVKTSITGKKWGLNDEF